MQFHSIRFKASVLYSLILALILTLFSTFVYLTVHRILYQDLDEELKVKAQEITSILYAYEQVERNRSHPVGWMLELLGKESGGTNQKMVIDDLWRSQLEVLNLKNDFINILNVRGRTVLSSSDFQGDIPGLFRKQFPFTAGHTVYASLSDEDHHLRAINLPVKLQNTQLIVQVGTPVDSITRILYRLFLSMAAAVAVLSVATSFMGGYFAWHSLRPVQDVVALANRITHKDLSERIEKKDADQEMKDLVNAFNVMISRLETSFGHINEFSSHAAHELKTPLAVLRGEIELALGQEHTSREYRKVLEDCLGEIDRMIKVVKDLLLLAKLDYKPGIFHFERIDLIPLLDEIREQSQILAEPKGIFIDFRIPGFGVMVRADRVHLRRLFHNIIGNAIKYIPEKRSVKLDLDVRDKKCVIRISDTGDGIPEKHLKKIFDKFFRVHKEGEPPESGTGLGLSIALSIARAHGGDIHVQSGLHQGTTFTIILPAA